jgi:hypothetical protein
VFLLIRFAFVQRHLGDDLGIFERNPAETQCVALRIAESSGRQSVVEDFPPSRVRHRHRRHRRHILLAGRIARKRSPLRPIRSPSESPDKRSIATGLSGRREQRVRPGPVEPLERSERQTGRAVLVVEQGFGVGVAFFRRFGDKIRAGRPYRMCGDRPAPRCS